ncbi:unnamed protein product [Thelazia callipaeda]|uniref:Uncharacterized protein n=1 Tax=Thelazia callipaeda TaxID=103827 RepID=A0A0N5DBV8_THECL|nr:unnamed protein product [Thelazia callipaeda]
MSKVEWPLCRSLYSDKILAFNCTRRTEKQANSVIISIACRRCSLTRFLKSQRSLSKPKNILQAKQTVRV